MNCTEILKKARANIEDPTKWGKGHFKYDGCMCALGAIQQAMFPKTEYFGCMSRHEENMVFRVSEELVCPLGKKRVIKYNDANTTTHADVLEMFDRAIRRNTKDRLLKKLYDIRGVMK